MLSVQRKNGEMKGGRERERERRLINGQKDRGGMYRLFS